MRRSCPQDPLEKPLTVTGPGVRIPLSPPNPDYTNRDFSFMPFYTYILKSLKDGGYYFGHTSDIDNRLIKHNGKKVRSTKSRTPFVLHYFETFQTKSEAYIQEMYFKSIEGKKYLRGKGII
jgi:putative endonuclease